MAVPIFLTITLRFSPTRSISLLLQIADFRL
jgi:hypothetical protein